MLFPYPQGVPAFLADIYPIGLCSISTGHLAFLPTLVHPTCPTYTTPSRLPASPRCTQNIGKKGEKQRTKPRGTAPDIKKKLKNIHRRIQI